MVCSETSYILAIRQMDSMGATSWIVVRRNPEVSRGFSATRVPPAFAGPRALGAGVGGAGVGVGILDSGARAAGNRVSGASTAGPQTSGAADGALVLGPPWYGVAHPQEQSKTTRNHSEPAQFLQISRGLVTMEDTPANHWFYGIVSGESDSTASRLSTQS